MYWPIGVPSIFATTRHELHPKQQTISDDGLTTPRNKSLDKGAAFTGEEEDDAQQQSQTNGNEEKKVARRVSENGSSTSNGTSQGEAEKDPGGEIVGIAVARSGHMFITITRSTLTVWQTKVWSVIFLTSTKLILEV
jgi:RAB6A-GEF complex partner protein 1